MASQLSWEGQRAKSLGAPTRPRFQTTFAILGALCLLSLVVNAFVLGGDEFVLNLNSFLVSPLAILTAVMAARLWLQMKTGVQNRILWGGMLGGWTLWAVAESLWAVYSILGLDPYPSPADFFFLAGYVPMFIGFASRLWGLPNRPAIGQRIISGVISLSVIAATVVFIFIPILKEYDPQRFLESLLSLFYPLADMLLLVLVLNLLFTYGPGNYGLGWRMILTGFILVTISDLIFSYADWNGLYYPDSQATLLSTIAVDWLYNLSYLFCAFGAYILSVLLRDHDILEINFQPALVPNAHVLVFTNRDERVLEVSQNYYRLFPVQDVRLKPLADALGMTEQQVRNLHEELRVQRRLIEDPIHVMGLGSAREAWLSGLAVINPPNEYAGAVLLLRMVADDPAIDDGLNEYQRSVISNVLNKSEGSEERQVRQFFWDYHLAFITALFNLVLREGGPAMSQTLLDELQAIARKQGWELNFNPQTILEVDSSGALDLPREALPTLLEAAKQFASQLADAEAVESRLQEVDSKLGAAVRSTAEQYGDVSRRN